jgi:hypothetical protein
MTGSPGWPGAARASALRALEAGRWIQGFCQGSARRFLILFSVSDSARVAQEEETGPECDIGWICLGQFKLDSP